MAPTPNVNAVMLAMSTASPVTSTNPYVSMAIRSPALAGAIGMMRLPPCAAITSITVPTVTGSANAGMRQASEPRRIIRPSACQRLAGPVGHALGR